MDFAMDRSGSHVARSLLNTICGREIFDQKKSHEEEGGDHHSASQRKKKKKKKSSQVAVKSSLPEPSSTVSES